jgi:hypothetical protein
MKVPLLALALPAICLAQTPAQPRLVLDALQHDFGRVAPGATVTHRFKASNAGNAPLTISELKPACGCTSTVVGNRTLAPGQSTGLEVTFDATGSRGLIRKTVAVLSNDPAHPVQTLTFLAKVTPEVFVADDQVRFEDLQPGARPTASVKLETGTSQGIRVDDVDLSPAPWLGVTTRSEDKDLWVDFVLAADKLPPGKLFGTDTITLHVANPQPSAVKLSVHWARRALVVASPARVAWAGPAGQDRRTSVILEQRDHKPFHILSARTSSPLLQVVNLSAKAAARQAIEVQLSPTAQPGEYDEKIILTLDTLGHPDFEIRVLASLR